jgi:hypothetical protein
VPVDDVERLGAALVAITSDAALRARLAAIGPEVAARYSTAVMRRWFGVLALAGE